jgi:hypothetical protein
MIDRRVTRLVLVAEILVFGWSRPAAAERTTLPLNGTWSIAESIGPEEIPAHFDRKVAVPGLVNQAQPAFAGVDQYQTWEFIWDAAFWNSYPKPPPASPEVAKKCGGLGQAWQKRNYFWYQRTFTVPGRKQSAVLVINKAQFGTAVWLNGKKVGQRLGCFTASRFNITDALMWEGENRLLVRVGAHPGVMPPWAPYGTDNEKALWTPGIYDAVSIQLADNPAIEAVQVAPRIEKSEIVVQTRLVNRGPACSFDLVHRLRTWKGNEAVGKQVRQRTEMGAGEERLVTQTVPVPAAILWSPDNPFLYVLDTNTGGDSCSTRFGMREFQCSTANSRAMLNGKVIYLRGSSFCLYRFFEDPKCGGLPWDEAWVRKLLVEIPKRMHWNAMRVCIGTVPQQWLDIADEAGLLLQYEFPIWSSIAPTRCRSWKEDEVTGQFREFLRDNWNHPSIVIWDAANETHWPFLKEKLIPAVRGLDLSHRPWEDSYVGPQGPDDPYEVHPYLMRLQPPFFEMTELEQMKDGKTKDGKLPGEVCFAPHAAIINEYGWLWLHRDGSPMAASRPIYDHLVGPEATPAQRFEAYAYRLAGLTEFWRAYRNYAGVLYFTYLGGDPPTSITCDNFRDVRRLQFQPRFEHYVGEAFKPLGVYLNFWQPSLTAGARRHYRVMMVNDTCQPAAGKLEVVWLSEAGGREAGSSRQDYEIPSLGQASYDVTLATPAIPGPYVLAAKAYWDGKPWSPTVARRKVTVKDQPAK